MKLTQTGCPNDLDGVRMESTKMLTLNRAESREVDRRAIDEYGLPGLVLMENAGRGVAELLVAIGVKDSVLICAGKGNNGGDGFVIARHLENRGVPVKVFLFCDPSELRGDAAVNFAVLHAAKTPMQIAGGHPDFEQVGSECHNCEWIIDALLGTGAQGEIRDPLRGVIDCMNRASARRLAVDLPSGLDCDTGQPLGCCVCADHTATFVARKRGFDAPGAEKWTGLVHIIDIGIPRRLLGDLRSRSDDDSRHELPDPA